MRSLSRAACAAASAPLGAGVLGWPTSRWMTVSPAASFSAAAAMTSMTMNGSTAPPRRESLILLKFLPVRVMYVGTFVGTLMGKGKTCERILEGVDLLVRVRDGRAARSAKHG